MWPVLVNMSREDCCRTLRRLELEAYSKMISVFRAQGALEDSRKKLLDDLRDVLHISNDRHSAEARRVANDEVLATIAEHLAGPNTGLAWIREGRRKIPLMPRGIPQTAFTEAADEVSDTTAADNKELKNKIATEQLLKMAEGVSNKNMEQNITNEDEANYPPVAMEDQAVKIWETELASRKRKVPDGGGLAFDNVPPAKNIRNINPNTNQKHVNLSHIYSKYSQSMSSKSVGHSKHSYNQVSKVSTSRSKQSGAPRGPKPRKQTAKKPQIVLSKSQLKKAHEVVSSPPKQYNPVSLKMEVGPPGSFQASYAQSLMSTKGADLKSQASSTDVGPESTNVQMLATVPHELQMSDASRPDEPTLQAAHKPTTIIGKPSQIIMKAKTDITLDKKIPMAEMKILQKPKGIKLLSNRQVVVAPSATQKTLHMNKQTPAKVIRSISKQNTPEKVIVVSKPFESKAIVNSKVIVTSSAASTPITRETPANMQNNTPKLSEVITAKGIPATDIKVSAKTFLLNPKSGQKMVVVPSKARTKTGIDGQTMPVLHIKGMSTPMRLVPVNSQTAKSPTVSVVSRSSIVNSVTTSSKLVTAEPMIKTANMADIVPVKGLTPITTSRTSNAIVRPGPGKGNVIVLQKGTPINKTLTLNKSNSDMSKIIMGKNVNQLLQASRQDGDVQGSGNVIVLELNNDQSARPTTMSEILDNRRSVSRASDAGDKNASNDKLTDESQTLYDSQMTDDTGNLSSQDSTTESAPEDLEHIEDNSLDIMIEKDKANRDKNNDMKDTSSVTDWEIELDSNTRKHKDDDDKLNSLHLDLGMSGTDSETDYIVDRRKAKRNATAQEHVNNDNEKSYQGSTGMSIPARMLLSQLQDDGSSSNDSSFALKPKPIEKKVTDSKIEITLDKSESEALSKAKEKLSEKVAKSTQKRIDIYSTAISSADIHLDAFSYLEESIMAGDDEFHTREPRTNEQLTRYLEDSPSTDSQSISESSPSNK